MNRKLLWIGGTLLVLGAIAGAYFLRRSPTQTAALPDLLASIPRDASAVAYVDTAALRQSPLLTQLRASLGPAPNEEAEYKKFVQETGFDYSRDLDRAVIFVLPIVSAPPGGKSNTAGKQNMKVLAVGEGKFDHGKIENYALRNGGRVQTINGQRILFIPSGQDGASEPLSVAFLSPTRLAVATSSELLARTSPAAAPQTDAADDGGYRERLARFAGAPLIVLGRTGWAAPLVKTGNSVADLVLSGLGEVRWYSIVARPEAETLRVSVEGECSSTVQAMQLGLLLEGAQTLLSSWLKDPATAKSMKPEQFALLQHLARNARIERDANRVQIRAEFTSAEIAVAAGSASSGSPVKSSR